MTTIEDYLNGLFASDFSEKNIKSVLLKRGIEPGTSQENVSVKLKELSQADLYMVLFNTFSRGGETVTKGNWSRSTGAVNIGVNDRRGYLEAANLLYAKWGEASVNVGMKDGTNLW